MFEILLVWIPLCAVVAYVASQKGRSGVGMFFLSFFLSPLIGLLVTIALPARTVAVPAATHGNDLVLCHSCNRPRRLDALTCPSCGAGAPAPTDPHVGQKQCPACAEWIQQAAIKCRYCGEQQQQAAASGPAAVGVVEGMGYCPGCSKLRHASVPRCVYCRDTRPVTFAPPAKNIQGQAR